jgi:peptidoglycan/xylan/chitin deacetylase (PgdA/CDA1 family)
VLTAVPTSRAVVALTFDAGANAAGLPAILATLAAEHVPATFFLTGRFAQLFPDSARSIAAAGGLIGNHTYDHPDLTTLSADRLRQEVLDGAASIRTVTGAVSLPWFRFPYGAYDAGTLSAVNGLGYAAVGWTVDTLGWKGSSGGITSAIVQQRALGSLRPGEIVLMHVGSNPDDGTTLDAAALPGIVAGMRARGYGFVTLAASLTG